MKQSLDNSFHTQPLFYTTLLFILGITLAFFFPTEKEGIVLAALAVLLAFFIFFRDKNILTVILMVLLTLLGYERGRISLYRQAATPVALADAERSTALAGRVTERLRKKDGRMSALLETDSIRSGGKWLPARIRIRVNDKSGRLPDNGQRVWIYKSPERFATNANPGMFNARWYFDLHDIPLRLTLNARDSLRLLKNEAAPEQSLVEKAREAVSGILNRYLPAQASAIMHALLLGRKQNIDREVIGNFQQTGIIHVLAISGLHVGFIVLFLYTALSLLQIPESVRLPVTVLALALFAAIVEFKAPVMRASLMIVLYMLAKRMRRPVKPLQLLGLAALILLLWNPRELFMPGFQFSFAAVWGLLYGTRKIESLIPRFRGAGRVKRFFNSYVRQPFLASFCAVLATTPLTWYYYGVVQVGAVFFNIAVIPLIGLIVLLGIFLLIAASLPHMPVAGVAAILSFLISGFTSLVAHAAQWPVFQWHVGQAGIWQLILLLVLTGAVFNAREQRWRLAGMVSLGLLIFPHGLLNNAAPQLRVTYLDVGQGDACYIEFPNGQNMLVDAGDANFGFNAGAWYLEPYFKYRGVTRLTYVLITHPHSDHMGGLDYLFDKMRVDTLVLNELRVKSGLYRRLLAKAARHGIAIRHWQRGTRRHIGGSALYVLHPTDAGEHAVDPHGKEINNSSIVFRLLYGKTAFLFTGDAEIPAERMMTGFGAFLQSDVLKVGHHGSRTSTGDEFLERVNPRLAVISVGRKNKFKHPSAENIRRLSRRGARVLRTDRVGAIMLSSDGRAVQWHRWR